MATILFKKMPKITITSGLAAVTAYYTKNERSLLESFIYRKKDFKTIFYHADFLGNYVVTQSTFKNILLIPFLYRKLGSLSH